MDWPWRADGEAKAVLEHFGSTIIDARRHRYRAFIAEGSEIAGPVDYNGGGLIRSYGGWQAIREARRAHERRIGDERILGDSDFVAQSLEHDCLDVEVHTRRLQSGWDLPRLIKAVCLHLDVEVERITDKGRGNNLGL